MMHGEPTLSEADLPVPEHFDCFHPFLKGVFNQWHRTPFRLDGRNFVTAEQWMMFSKARLFADDAMANAIPASDSPDEQQRFGQRVQGFQQDVWDRLKIDVVYQGNLAKFSQNAGAARQLRATGSAMLVEANLRDWVWGVGLATDDPRLHSPTQWRGRNLLGRILTKARSDLEAPAEADREQR